MGFLLICRPSGFPIVHVASLVLSDTCEVERKGVEPSTSALRTQPLRDVSYTPEELATSEPDACTAACTGNAVWVNDNAQNDLVLQAVVEAWATLPEHVRATIAMIAATATVPPISTTLPKDPV